MLSGQKGGSLKATAANRLAGERTGNILGILEDSRISRHGLRIWKLCNQNPVEDSIERNTVKQTIPVYLCEPLKKTGRQDTFQQGLKQNTYYK